MKQRRIKKLVKGHLTSRDDKGDKATGQDLLDKIEALNALKGADLLEALTGPTGGDADGVAYKDDAFPFDARESADADGDGIGNNQEIVTMFKQIQQLGADILALTAPTQAAADAADAQLQIMENNAAGANDDGVFDDAEEAYLVQKKIVDDNKASSDAKVLEASDLLAAIEALPQPAAGITIENLQVLNLHSAVAPAVKSSAQDELDTVIANAGAIDTQEARFSTVPNGFEDRRGNIADPDPNT